MCKHPTHSHREPRNAAEEEHQYKTALAASTYAIQMSPEALAGPSTSSRQLALPGGAQNQLALAQPQSGAMVPAGPRPPSAHRGVMPRAGTVAVQAPPTVAAGTPRGGSIHPSALQVRYANVDAAYADPAVQKIMKQNYHDVGGVDPRYIQSVDMMRKLKFAQALGSDLGAAVSLNVGEHQGEWGNLIKQAGLLMRKSSHTEWEPLIFFCYNGFLAACEIPMDGKATVELATLNLKVAHTTLGDPMPLPLKGCKIFASDAPDAKTLTLHFPVPGVKGKVQQVDLAAQDTETRERWIEEIYRGSFVGEGYGSRNEYVPKSLRGKSDAELVAASQVVKSTPSRTRMEVFGPGLGSTRGCMADGEACVLM